MIKLAVAALAWLAAFCAHAQLSIEITGAGANRIPIAIAPFAGEAALPVPAPGGTVSVTAIVRADLERSGLFRTLELPPLVPQPTESSSVNFAEWKARLADALVVGSIAARPDGRFEVRFEFSTGIDAETVAAAYTSAVLGAEFQFYQDEERFRFVEAIRLFLDQTIADLERREAQKKDR